jgi:hypothetical protein
MPDILTDTLSVKGSKDNAFFNKETDEFTFKIPSPRDQNRVKTRALALRRQDDPTGPGWEEGLDWLTINSYRGMAAMEVLLEKASVPWAFTADSAGQMICDSSKFPRTLATEYFAEVWVRFGQELDTFRNGRIGDGQPTGDQALAGGTGTGG